MSFFFETKCRRFFNEALKVQLFANMYVRIDFFFLSIIFSLSYYLFLIKTTMPQIDKVTFLTTVYWTFVFYFFLYLDLSATYLYKFLTNMKFRHQRMCWVYRNVQINALRARILASRGFALKRNFKF